METIKIPYDDYKELLDYKYALTKMEEDIFYIIEHSDLNYTKNDLRIEDELTEFIKKIYPGVYYSRLKDLKENREEAN